MVCEGGRHASGDKMYQASVREGGGHRQKDMGDSWEGVEFAVSISAAMLPRVGRQNKFSLRVPK